MSDATRVLTNLMMSKGASLRLGKSQTTFPENPAESQLAIVDGIPYIYTVISGFWSWYPMSSRKSSYVHLQAVESLNWEIPHGLGSQDIILVVYDVNNVVQTYSKMVFLDDNTIRLEFTEAVKGRAVMFATNQINTPFLQATKVVTDELELSDGTVSVSSQGLIVDGKNVSSELTTLETSITETEQRVIETTQKPIGNQRLIQRHPHLANII